MKQDLLNKLVSEYGGELTVIIIDGEEVIIKRAVDEGYEGWVKVTKVHKKISEEVEGLKTKRNKLKAECKELEKHKKEVIKAIKVLRESK